MMHSLTPFPQLAPPQPAPGVAAQLNNDRPQNDGENLADTTIRTLDPSELDETFSLTDQRATSQPHNEPSTPRSDIDAGNILPITHNEDDQAIDQAEPTPGHTADPYDADDEGNDSDEEDDLQSSTSVLSHNHSNGTVQGRQLARNPRYLTWMDIFTTNFNRWQLSGTAIRASSPLLYNTASPNVHLAEDANPDGSPATEDTDLDSTSSSSIATLRAWFDLPSSTESESDSYLNEEDDEDSDEDGPQTYYTDGSGYDEASSGSASDSGSDSDSDDGRLATIIAQVDSELDSLLPWEFEELMGLDTEHEVGAEEDTDGDASARDDEGALWDLAQGFDEEEGAMAATTSRRDEEEDLPELVLLPLPRLVLPPRTERLSILEPWMLYDPTAWLAEPERSRVRDVLGPPPYDQSLWVDIVRGRVG